MIIMRLYCDSFETIRFKL